MANKFKKIGINYDIVVEGASSDKRIGQNHIKIFHEGYRGYSGKCFPKDMRALIEFGDQQGVDLKLHKIAEEINNKLSKK